MPESNLETGKYQSKLTATEVKVSGRHFVDTNGRVLELRGANVSSCSKVYVHFLLHSCLLSFTFQRLEVQLIS